MNFPNPSPVAMPTKTTSNGWIERKSWAKRKTCPSPQIALAYVVQQPGLDVYALIGTFTGAEYQENIRALEVKLADEEMEWLDLRRDTR